MEDSEHGSHDICRAVQPTIREVAVSQSIRTEPRITRCWSHIVFCDFSAMSDLAQMKKSSGVHLPQSAFRGQYSFSRSPISLHLVDGETSESLRVALAFIDECDNELSSVHSDLKNGESWSSSSDICVQYEVTHGDKLARSSFQAPTRKLYPIRSTMTRKKQLRRPKAQATNSKAEPFTRPSET
ncbi:unnamed protein product [Phytophthora lilii]|uniref:Unnamed protein product n=1 Tax=Phytophthora lilii TaxID=2077276 RepID=A0A9W6TC90_9STRA|nr:unnamed protein product [Phytophthora lilii]